MTSLSLFSRLFLRLTFESIDASGFVFESLCLLNSEQVF